MQHPFNWNIVINAIRSLFHLFIIVKALVLIYLSSPAKDIFYSTAIKLNKYTNSLCKAYKKVMDPKMYMSLAIPANERQAKLMVPLERESTVGYITFKMVSLESMHGFIAFQLNLLLFKKKQLTTCTCAWSGCDWLNGFVSE